MAFCSWIRWACWIAVSRRRRSASDFGFILRLEREESSGDELEEEGFLRIDFGRGCEVDILAILQIRGRWWWCVARSSCEQR